MLPDFRYGPGTFSPTTIQLKTNWKRRAILNAATWSKLQSNADDILGFLPKPGFERTLMKELDLVHRLCRATMLPREHLNLKDIAFTLHRDGELSKDEARLAEFEFYSTLIVMQAQSKKEVSM